MRRPAGGDVQRGGNPNRAAAVRQADSAEKQHLRPRGAARVAAARRAAQTLSNAAPAARRLPEARGEALSAPHDTGTIINGGKLGACRRLRRHRET